MDTIVSLGLAGQVCQDKTRGDAPIVVPVDSSELGAGLLSQELDVGDLLRDVFRACSGRTRELAGRRRCGGRR